MATGGHFVFPIDAKNHRVLVIWDLNGSNFRDIIIIILINSPNNIDLSTGNIYIHILLTVIT